MTAPKERTRRASLGNIVALKRERRELVQFPSSTLRILYYYHIPQSGGEYAGGVAQGDAMLLPLVWVRRPHGKTVNIATHAWLALREKLEVSRERFSELKWETKFSAKAKNSPRHGTVALFCLYHPPSH